MGQERLTNLSILYIEKNMINLINIDQIIEKFAEKNRRTMLL